MPAPADFDLLGIGQELVRQLLDRRRHGGGKQHGLARFGQLITDEFDVGDEPHVEHPVRLVDHQQLASAEQNFPAFEQVHQSARRGDQHIHTFVQCFELVAHLHAADQQRHLEIVVGAILLEILRHLRREFAGWFQNQRSWHQRTAAAAGHHVDHRKHEAGGLARAGLRDADQVLHHQHGGNGLRLDRRRLGITGFRDRFQKFIGKAEIGK